MSTYRMSISRLDDNPRKGARPYGEMPEPDMIESRCLEVVLKEEEFDRIKQALLTVWK